MIINNVRSLLLALVAIALLAGCGSGGDGGDPLPSAPGNVTAEPLAGAIKISWEDKSSNESSFIIYRALADGGDPSYTEIAAEPANSTSHTDPDVSADTRYLYAVTARNEVGESARVEVAQPVQSLPEEGDARLTVVKVGRGQGVVTSDPAGIECIQRPEVVGDDCTGDYSEGQEVTLIAQPDGGSVFAGWEGACSGTGVCRVTMDGSKEVSVIFSPPESTLTVDKGGSGSGTVLDGNTDGSYINCGSNCDYTTGTGTILVLEANPSEGSLFAGWSGCPEVRSNGDCEVQINTDVTVTATFKEPSLSIESFTASPRNVAPGGEVTLSWDVTGDDAYTLSLSNSRNDTVLDVTGQTSVTVNPSASVTYTLTATSDIETDTDTETVTVGDEPEVTLFRVRGGDDTIATGSSAVLEWSVAGAGDIEVTISGIAGTFEREGSTPIDTSQPGTYDYELTATSSFGTDTDEVTLSVGDAPVITSFTATPTSVTAGGTVTLEWNVDGDGTVTLTLDDGDGPERVTGNGTSVSVNETTTYTLTAESEFGNDNAIRIVTVQYELTVVNDGGGVITSNPTGINCGSECEQFFLDGVSVDLTAQAATGFEFDSWSGACSGSDPNSCTVTMNANRAVTANFTLVPPPPPPPAEFTLTVAKAGEGSGTVASMPAGINCGNTCTADFDEDEEVTLTATPDAGVTVTWTNCTVSPTDPNVCTVTMDADKEVTATFALPPPDEFELNVDVQGGGTVTSSPAGINCEGDCTEDYTEGQTVTLTAIADEGFEFEEWSDNCSSTGATTCQVLMDAPKTVTATFTPLPPPPPNEHTLTVTLAGTGGGTVTSAPSGITCGSDCAEAYVEGTEVVLNAASNNGSRFMGWTGDCAGTGGCTVIMDGPKNVTATFTDLFTVSVAITGPGTVTSNPAGISCNPTCSEDFLSGTSVVLTANPETGANFSGWGGDCAASGTDTTCEVTSDADVTAAFSVPAGVSSVTVTPEGANINQGETVPLEVDVETIGGAPETVNWTSDNLAVATVNSSGVVMGESPGTATITATSTFDLTKSDTVAVTVNPPPEPPEIGRFTAAPDSIAEEGSSTLEWSVTGDAPIGVTISGIAETFGPNGSTAVSPDATTEYALTATNDAGSDTDAETVVVGTEPSITSFTAEPSTVTEGSSATLLWNVTGSEAIQVVISGVEGIFGPDGSTEVTPTATTDYTLSATNGFGADSATVTLTVVPLNESPAATADGPFSVDEGGTLTIAAPGVLSNDTDPEGSALVAQAASNPASGALSLNPDGGFTYVHDGGETTSDAFEYVASDGNSDSSPAAVTLSITPVNDAPTAVADAYDVVPGEALNVPSPGVLGNDGDPEGQSLTAILGAAPAHGTLSLQPDGSFVYVLDDSAALEDSFSYVASDGVASSSAATVTLRVLAVPLSRNRS